MKDEIKEMEKKIACLQEEISCLCEQLKSCEIKINRLEEYKKNAGFEIVRLKGKVDAYEYCLGGRHEKDRY